MLNLANSSIQIFPYRYNPNQLSVFYLFLNSNKMKQLDKISQNYGFEQGNEVEDFPTKNSQDDFNFQCFKQMLNVRIYRKEIQKKMEELNQKRQKIYQKVVYYGKKTEEEFRDFIRGEAPERKKRNRRNAQQIDRQYVCRACTKKYGSEGSMHQHIKLKHPQLHEQNKKNAQLNNSQNFGEEINN